MSDLTLKKEIYDFVELVEGYKESIHKDIVNIPTIGRGLALMME